MKYAREHFWPAALGSTSASLAMGQTGWGEVGESFIIGIVVAVTLSAIRERSERAVASPNAGATDG